MDPRVYGGAKSQAQIQGQGPGQGGRVRHQEDPYSQRGKQEESYNPRGNPKQEPKDPFNSPRGGKETDLQDSSSNSSRGKQHPDLFVQQQRGKQQPDLFGQQQRGKQHQELDLFAQKGKQEDIFAQRGRQLQEDLFKNDKGSVRAETSLRVEEEPYGGGDSSKRGRGGRDGFGNFSSTGNEVESVQLQAVQYASVGGEAELHAAPGTDLMHNPAMQTMVKMVTMLNFMKVELGETKTLKSKEQWRAAGAEFVGTLLFVYLGCGSVVATGMLYAEMTPARLVAIAIAHGLAISFLTAATGAISGGHLNPAVTLAFVIAGKENLVRAGLYVAAQLLGAIFGALFLQFVTPANLRGTLGSHDISEFIYTSQGFLMEMMLTFTLVFVIFGVAVDRRGPGVIAPLPIGFAVLVDHLVGVPYTGASMNPARSFGPALVSGYFGSAHLVYWVAPCFGATAAAALYRYAFLEPAEAAARAAAIITPR